MTGHKRRVRRFEASEWQIYRELRLRALAESPDAFGSTFALEQVRTDEEWQAWLSAGASSPLDLPLLGLAGGEAAGLAWAKVDSSNPSAVNLFQMWVAPEHRSHGLGAELLHQAIAWAQARGAATLSLGVTLGDSPAVRLYRRAGFVPSGQPEPLRPNSPLLAQAMVLRLGTGAALASETNGVIELKD